MKKIILGMSFTFLIVLPLALAVTTSSANAEGTVRIGVTVRMLTENGQKYGQMIKDQFEAVNAAGGINGNKLEVYLLDDQCKPDIGVANVNRFIHQNKVHVVVGSTCSSVSMPIVPVTAKAEVPQIIPHSTNAKITKQGSAWVFRVSVSERFYSAVHGKWLAENVGKKVAYLYTTDSASISFAEKYMEYMRKNFGAEPACQILHAHAKDPVDQDQDWIVPFHKIDEACFHACGPGPGKWKGHVILRLHDLLQERFDLIHDPNELGIHVAQGRAT